MTQSSPSPEAWIFGPWGCRRGQQNCVEQLWGRECGPDGLGWAALGERKREPYQFTLGSPAEWVEGQWPQKHLPSSTVRTRGNRGSEVPPQEWESEGWREKVASNLESPWLTASSLLAWAPGVSCCSGNVPSHRVNCQVRATAWTSSRHRTMEVKELTCRDAGRAQSHPRDGWEWQQRPQKAGAGSVDVWARQRWVRISFCPWGAAHLLRTLFNLLIP